MTRAFLVPGQSRKCQAVSTHREPPNAERRPRNTTMAIPLFIVLTALSLIGLGFLLNNLGEKLDAFIERAEAGEATGIKRPAPLHLTES